MSDNKNEVDEAREFRQALRDLRHEQMVKLMELPP